MRKMGRDNIGENHYAELLAKTPSKMIEFIELFNECLGLPIEQISHHMIDVLLKGFKLRIPVLVGSDPGDVTKLQFLRLYQTFVGNNIFIEIF